MIRRRGSCVLVLVVVLRSRRIISLVVVCLRRRLLPRSRVVEIVGSHDDDGSCGPGIEVLDVRESGDVGFVGM